MSKCGEILKKCGESATNYTLPVIQFGKMCKSKNEQAKEKWLIEFEVNGKRKRVSNYLNKIKSYSEKFKAFIQLRDDIEEALINGTYNDAVKSVAKPIDKPIISPISIPFNIPDRLDIIAVPLVTDVIKEYVSNSINRGLRAQTVQNYKNNLKFLDAEYGNRLITDIYYKDMEHLLNKGINIKGWNNRTHNSIKAVFNSFFVFAIDCRYINDNPCKRIKSKYCSKSENNKAFSKEDFTLILKAIEDKKILNLVVKSIYYTCIRPKELLLLQVKHIDFVRRTMFVPAHIAKNKQDGYVHIDDAYLQLLIDNYKDAPQEAYLFSHFKKVWGFKAYHKNAPYLMLAKVIKALGLTGKGYTLYSTKHYSNIQRFLGGWKIAEIMKANRHASIQQTENYLRHLVDYVDVTKKEIPTL